MANKVDILTTQRLIEKFCRGECENRKKCNPNITHDGNDQTGLDWRVAGCEYASECPIMARVWPSLGWVSADNHAGRCGYQEQN